MSTLVSIEALIHAIAPRLDSTRRYHLPMTARTTSLCRHCGRRIEVSEIVYGHPSEKDYLMQGIYGVESTDKKLNRMFETFCSAVCFRAFPHRTVTAFEQHHGIAPTCKNGHRMTPENSYRYRTTGVTVCKTCHREARQRYRERRADPHWSLQQALDRAEQLAQRHAKAI